MIHDPTSDNADCKRWKCIATVYQTSPPPWNFHESNHILYLPQVKFVAMFALNSITGDINKTGYDVPYGSETYDHAALLNVIKCCQEPLVWELIWNVGLWIYVKCFLAWHCQHSRCCQMWSCCSDSGDAVRCGPCGRGRVDVQARPVQPGTRYC